MSEEELKKYGPGFNDGPWAKGWDERTGRTENVDIVAMTPHRTMTEKEYADLKLIGWHMVCKNVDGCENVGIRYLSFPPPTGRGPSEPDIQQCRTRRTSSLCPNISIQPKTIFESLQEQLKHWQDQYVYLCKCWPDSRLQQAPPDVREFALQRKEEAQNCIRFFTDMISNIEGYVDFDYTEIEQRIVDMQTGEDTPPDPERTKEQ